MPWAVHPAFPLGHPLGIQPPSALSARMAALGGFLCVCLLSEVRTPGLCQGLAVSWCGGEWKSGGHFQESSANRSHCANLLREERLIKTRRPLGGNS
jgi:hypothetical protein